MITLIPYGPEPDQFAELGQPHGTPKPTLVVLIHGGFWRDQYRLDLMHGLAATLLERGYRTWNIEYRRVGASGGGYPETLDDIAAALDRGAQLDVEKLAVIGHSAGGHLALWNAGRLDAAKRPDLTISLAGVCDVIAANRNGVGVDATRNFFGGDYDEASEAYEHAQPDPMRFAGRVVLLHGDRDQSVPLDQSEAIAPAVDRVEVLADADHFDVIDPSGSAWQIVFEELDLLNRSSNL